MLTEFSEKSLRALGEFYVYALADPRNKHIFYIGQGSGNRIFDHEKTISSNTNECTDLKSKIIAEIKSAGLNAEKIIINSNLTKEEALAAEASLINAFNFINDAQLTNSQAGHHSQEALTAEDFERENGADELQESDIRHKIMIIKINKLYRRNMTPTELYDAVRGCWKASESSAENVEYVLGAYHSLIVGVYKPTQWHRVKNEPQKCPAHHDQSDASANKKLFFIDENFENGQPLDEHQLFYLGKSIKPFIKKGAQSPFMYLAPSQR